MNSLFAQRAANRAQSALFVALERLSSGKRINSAKDDAAGLGIAERMTTQINGMNQAIKNANDGISLAQTAEGALASSNEMLQRIRTLAVQSSNATNASVDRQSLQDEVNQLTAELNHIATTTTFNGKHLLDGSCGAFNFQVGANAGDLITMTGSNLTTSVYGDNRLYSKAKEVGKGAAITDANILVTGSLGSGQAIDASKGLTAKELAAQVNKESSRTGVLASAKTEALFTAKSNASYSLSVQSNNGKPVTISFSIGDTQDENGYAQAVNAFNAVTSKTGITAEFSLGGIKLTNATGETITLATKESEAKLANINYDSVTNQKSIGTAVAIDQDGVSAVGTVTFDSQDSFAVSASSTDSFYSKVSSSHLNSVSSLDITTFEGAQLAIQIADSAINVMNKARSQYGALQSRFNHTIENLSINVENTSQARSRILDADYASETAELSRAAILQQVAVAMISQANQMPQMILSLLRSL